MHLADKRIEMNSKQQSPPNGASGYSPGFASRLADGNLLPIAVLALFSLALYFNSLSNGFVFDDYADIVENKHIKDLSNNLPSLFNNAYFKIAAGESSYRPVATFSYFIIPFSDRSLEKI